MNYPKNKIYRSKIDRNKLVYEQAGVEQRYFLDWRYKLIAGFIVIISSIGYFIITWLHKPENFSEGFYILTCSIGIIITIFFAFLNHRVTEILWKYKNVAYLYEKDMGIEGGLYGNLMVKKVKINLDKYDHSEKSPRPSFLDFINPSKHFGALNCFFCLLY